MIAKLLGLDRGTYAVDRRARCFCPDWVAGMFMLFPSAAFEAVGGFDENFYLYYEDVDICVRLRHLGYRVAVMRGASVVHNARRDSRRCLRFARWHAASMARYFWKHWGRLPAARLIEIA